MVISRIRHGSETVLSLNDNNNPASLALDDFFEGDGNGLTLYLQTEADGVVSFDVADQLSGNRNSNIVRFTLPADAQTLLNNIPDGGRWIFALAQATPVAQDHTVDGGDLTWGFEIPEATVTHTPAAATAGHAVDGGNLSWGFELPEATVTHVAATPGTVSLTGFTSGVTFIRWSDDQLLGSDFSLDGGDQTLSDAFMWYTGGAAGQVGIYLSGVNDRFTADFEATGTFTFTASDGETLEVQIADASMTEPYLWTPTNGVDVIAFANHVISLTDHDATLTLTSGGPPTTQDHAVNGGDLDWGFELPEATITILRAAGFAHEVDGGNLSLGLCHPAGHRYPRCSRAGVTMPLTAGRCLGASTCRGQGSPIRALLNIRWRWIGITTAAYANANASVWGRVIEGTFQLSPGPQLRQPNARGEVWLVRWKSNSTTATNCLTLTTT